MKLLKQTPKKVLKAFLKQKPLRSEIDLFKTNLISLLDKISVIEKRPTDESEEHLKNDLRDFLRDTYYRDINAINTKDKKDLVIHLGKTTDSEVGAIIEAKRPTNIGEMVSADNPNKKALHELILYYLDERNKAGNNQLKQLVMTNVNEWYIIDANYFDKHIYRNAQIKKLYETKLNDKKDNPFFYEEIAKIISKIDVEIPCVYFDIREYDTIIRNNKKEDDRELSALLKILSPQHLLKLASPNDSNSLNEKFYKELLHIIGLEEAKENGKNIIRRKKESRNAASLIEGTIEALNTEDVLHRLPDQTIYGENKEERIFNISLELGITWINRILFLKLLEGQLITYHQGNKDYRFLNTETINDFDELFKLFHKVLAVNLNERSEAIKNKYSRVPYLNSSLFEISELEDQTIKINSLDNGGQLELIGITILKDKKKKAASLPTLDYLFQFLDAYDFASEGTEDVQEDNKSIINASVLGKVFEKINGYKDGSIFTPAFITMYMCKQSIRLAVVEKFNEVKKWDIKQFDELYNKIENRKEASEIINTLKICDPAVGSGHFLVSALNEIIAIKSELGVLMDEKNKTLRDYEIEIINDELIITDENGNIFAYNPKSNESNRVQKTLFQEKQIIIENCLFGVDINPNSVKICRLRLWIELLKNAYYREETNYLELETLPNIDINIKCGNSLLSRFTLDADLSKALKSIKYDVKAYRGFVNEYKNEKSRDVKRGLQKIIDNIKSDFRTEIGNNDPKQIRLSKLSGDLYNLLNQGKLFALDSKQKKSQKEKQTKLEADINKLAKEIEEIKSNAIYKNAFEWRFEFPEVLSNDGEFEGFDVIIGNPPYVTKLKPNEISYFQDNYVTIQGKKYDLFRFFYEKTIPLTKKFGIHNFIVPDVILNLPQASILRSHILDKYSVFKINTIGNNPFDEVQLEPVITFIKNEKKSSNVEYYDLTLNNEKRFVNSENWKRNNFDFNLSQNNTTDNLIEKLKSSNLTIKDTSIWKKGLGVYSRQHLRLKFSKEEVEKIMTERPWTLDYKKDETFGKELQGKDVGRYEVKWNEKKWLSYGPWLAFQRPIEFFYGPRILVREITTGGKYKVFSSYVEDKYYNNQSMFNGILKPNSKFDLKYLLALINSTLFSYWQIETSPKANRKLFPTLLMETVENFPIRDIDKSEQKQFIDLVNKILEVKQQGKEGKDLEKQIDELVYKLYDITTDEQKIIEN